LNTGRFLPVTQEILIFSNNQSCIAVAKDPIVYSCTKYINVRYYYIRELVSYRKATVEYVPSGDILADVLTKLLAAIAFNSCIRGLVGL
jgi:hypothetical protein